MLAFAGVVLVLICVGVPALVTRGAGFKKAVQPDLFNSAAWSTIDD